MDCGVGTDGMRSSGKLQGEEEVEEGPECLGGGIVVEGGASGSMVM